METPGLSEQVDNHQTEEWKSGQKNGDQGTLLDIRTAYLGKDLSNGIKIRQVNDTIDVCRSL